MEENDFLIRMKNRRGLTTTESLINIDDLWGLAQ
jgi:hypothetical protein